MSQKNKWIRCFILIIFTSIFHPLIMHGMNSDNAEKRFDMRSLPSEICKKILLSHDHVSMRDVFVFLGSQPILLAKQVDPLFVKIEDGYVVTKSVHHTMSWDRLVTKTWDVHTGKELKKINVRKPFVFSLPVVNDSISIVSDWMGDSGHERSGAMYITIRDTNTQKMLYNCGRKDSVIAAIDGDNAVIAYKCEAKVVLWDKKNGPVKIIVLMGNANVLPSAVALCGNAVVVGFKNGYLKVLDANSCRCIQKWYGHKGNIQSIVLYGNEMITGSADCTAKIWEVGTGNLLHVFVGPNGHTHGIDLVDMNGTIAVTASKKEKKVKIWPLKINFDALTEKDPLFWIINEADMLQLNFIWRAYAATIAQEKFFIDLPKKLGKIKEDETQEQWDGRLYFTFPKFVREYLCKCLAIRRSDLVRKTSSKLLKIMSW